EIAGLIACIAEVDARRLFLPAGDDSMFAYCIRRYRFTRETAFKRIRAARTARQFPVILAALADGRLSLSAVVLLASHLTAENAEELLAAARDKTKSEIEQLLAQHFPQPDVPARLQVLPVPGDPTELSPGTVGMTRAEHAAGRAGQLSPGTVEAAGPRPKVAPLSEQRFRRPTGSSATCARRPTVAAPARRRTRRSSRGWRSRRELRAAGSIEARRRAGSAATS